MFDNIRQDLQRARRVNSHSLWNELTNPGTQAVMVYRFGHWATKLRIPVIRHILILMYIPLAWFIRGFAGVNIPTQAEIGPGLCIHTWSGVFLPPGKIGSNCLVQHGVVINWGVKEIGDRVRFGPGAKVIKPVRIGHGAYIGANAVVMDDVPDNAVMVGIPARVVKIRGQRMDSDALEENEAAAS